MKRFLHNPDGLDDKHFINSLNFKNLKDEYLKQKMALFSGIDERHFVERDSIIRKKHSRNRRR